MKWPNPSNQLSFILTSFLTSCPCFLFPLNLLLTKYLFALHPPGQNFSYSILMRKPWYANSSTSSSTRTKLLDFTLG